jgi:hypothetical protein
MRYADMGVSGPVPARAHSAAPIPRDILKPGRMRHRMRDRDPVSPVVWACMRRSEDRIPAHWGSTPNPGLHRPGNAAAVHPPGGSFARPDANRGDGGTRRPSALECPPERVFCARETQACHPGRGLGRQGRAAGGVRGGAGGVAVDVSPGPDDRLLPVARRCGPRPILGIPGWMLRRRGWSVVRRGPGQREAGGRRRMGPLARLAPHRRLAILSGVAIALVGNGGAARMDLRWVRGSSRGPGCRRSAI